MVQCEDCHEKGENTYHATHWGDLSCQVCHSQPYKNCNGCHTGGQGITGSSYFTFKIAKNPKQSERRPYKIAVVRHIPIARDTYAAWGLDLPFYDSVPTWKYASPHNIVKNAPQTEVNGWCGGSCHGSDYYLTLEDLQNNYPDEVEANKHLVLEK
jgi:thiosulfate/3-mercaptopyruvate sulfurtransferase